MRQVGRGLVAFCAVGIVILGAGLSAVESQAKERTTRPARLYFLREKGLMDGLRPDVQVDGKSIGAVGNGAYLVIDRPPGLHQLAVGNTLAVIFETEVQVEAGQSYFFNIAPRASGVPLQDLAGFALVGGKGQPMQAKSPLRAALAGPIFYRLEPAAGAAEIERLKAP